MADFMIERLCVAPQAPQRLAAAVALAAQAPDPWGAAALKAALAEPRRLCLLALAKGGAPVGLACFFVVEDGAELEQMVVDGAARRRGVAGALLAAAEPLLYTMGARRLLLEVRASNAAAIALYQKHGFKALGARPGMYQNPKEDGLLMGRQVTQ